MDVRLVAHSIFEELLCVLRSLFYLENKRWSSITGLQVWYLCGEHQGRDNNKLEENCSYRT